MHVTRAHSIMVTQYRNHPSSISYPHLVRQQAYSVEAYSVESVCDGDVIRNCS